MNMEMTQHQSIIVLCLYFYISCFQTDIPKILAELEEMLKADSKSVDLSITKDDLHLHVCYVTCFFFCTGVMFSVAVQISFHDCIFSFI